LFFNYRCRRRIAACDAIQSIDRQMLMYQRFSFITFDLLRILWITLEVAALKNCPVDLA
jgi:hypothetical protein